ncbi:transcription elongation factor [Synoicihabitans lomoniglobus]|uniref:Transcription elongation factor n=1 Tax=Synoicihabitans lomoniglobus TaxID=2909285 RepID=A0AAF0CSB3_9BACT|nr:GreA/GreB family elongation factor [Opitutaceae bacterium LMO-M01]WED67086.1 transcription elongation factor [Opitutaceae bacterium LMO-M01]
MPDKTRLITALIEKLEADRDLQTRAALLARDEATNEESRAENKYDTRGQEAAYLAEGQAKLAAELADAIRLYRSLELPATPPPAALKIGSVFTIERLGGPLHGLIGPRAGGTDFTVDDTTYTVITPSSPLGRAVLGRKAGDTVYLVQRGKPQPHRITATA